MWRLGIVDFDSSHCVEFARRFNQVRVDREQFVEGARIVAAWAGSSVMAPERIEGFQKQIEEIGIPLVDQMEDLIDQIDAVLILSLCGSAHRERLEPFLEAGIPAYVDKPFACSVDDAKAMIDLANKNEVCLFNGSALRFANEVRRLTGSDSLAGTIQGAITYGPSKRAPLNPGLFHYGIHSVEVLFELMGTGCVAVTTTHSDGCEVVTGQWSDGRLGTVRGNRTGSTSYGFVAFAEHASVSSQVSTRFAYRNLCQQIIASFESKQPSVAHESSLEVVQFIQAALLSEQSSGATVKLVDT